MEIPKNNIGIDLYSLHNISERSVVVLVDRLRVHFGNKSFLQQPDYNLPHDLEDLFGNIRMGYIVTLKEDKNGYEFRTPKSLLETAPDLLSKPLNERAHSEIDGILVGFDETQIDATSSDYSGVALVKNYPYRQCYYYFEITRGALMQTGFVSLENLKFQAQGLPSGLIQETTDWKKPATREAEWFDIKLLEDASLDAVRGFPPQSRTLTKLLKATHFFVCASQIVNSTISTRDS